METAQIVPLRIAVPPKRPSAWVDGDTIVVEHLRMGDKALASYLGQRQDEDRADVVERALRIGLLALQDAGMSLDVDFVRREFDSLLEHNETMNKRVAEALDQVLRQNFGDQDGRLPRTLERFLGDRGQLSRFINELFDEGKRDSAIGRIRTLLGTYFDGDASRLAQLLDPTRMGAPLHQFRSEITAGFEKLNDRLTAIEAAYAARGAERARSAAKGGDFEDLLEQMLTEIVAGTGDVLERTADAAGDVIRSRKGDFVLTIDPQWCGGQELRIVVEAKDRDVSWREIREELNEAKRNRGAAAALAVFTPAHAPAGIGPFDLRFGHVVCVIDAEAPDAPTLKAAVRLARLHGLAALAESANSEVDAGRVLQIVGGVRTELDAVRQLKVQLTSIRGTADQVAAGLDRMRDKVLARVAEAESQLEAARSPAS